MRDNRLRIGICMAFPALLGGGVSGDQSKPVVSAVTACLEIKPDAASTTCPEKAADNLEMSFPGNK